MAYQKITFTLLLVVVIIASVYSSPVPAGADVPNTREGRFYGGGGGFSGSQASAMASSGATGGGFGYPLGGGFAGSSAHAGASSLGFGK